MRRIKTRQIITGKPETKETNKRNEIKEKNTQFYRKIFILKNSKEIWKDIHHIFNSNINKLQPDPSALNNFSNKTAERLVGENSTIDNAILSHTDSLTNNPNSFKLRKATNDKVFKSPTSLRNDCSFGYENIQVLFIKPQAD